MALAVSVQMLQASNISLVLGNMLNNFRTVKRTDIEFYCLVGNNTRFEKLWPQIYAASVKDRDDPDFEFLLK